MAKTLIDYIDQEKHKVVSQQTVPSGIKSPNSEREMRVIVPLVEHPEIKGLYKAIDPGTKTIKPWTGWVEYTPPQEETPAQPQKSPRDIFMQLCDDYRRRKSLLDLGLFSADDLGMTKLAEEIKKAFKPEYI